MTGSGFGTSIGVIQYYLGHEMTLSVRLDPAIEARVEEEAKRLGITKSEFVKDALIRTLGMKNPAELLKQVRNSDSVDDACPSENVSEQVKVKLREKYSS